MRGFSMKLYTLLPFWLLIVTTSLYPMHQMTIHEVIILGQEPTIRRYLELDQKIVNARDASGYSPLHVASALGYQSIVTLLLQSGANVYAQDFRGRTPLHYAACRNFENIARLLLEHGASSQIEDRLGDTPLTLASKNKSFQTVKLLENPPISILQAANSNNLDAVRLLLDLNQALVNVKDPYDFTPLHIAAGLGYLDMVNLLLGYGAAININQRDRAGRTPLHLAAENNNNLIAKVLLDNSADINAEDNFHRTPSQIAQQSKSHDTLILLQEWQRK